MTNKIRAKIIREITDTIVEHKIELYMIDIDNKDYEDLIGMIHVDEIEISADFIKYLYETINKEK